MHFIQINHLSYYYTTDKKTHWIWRNAQYKIQKFPWIITGNNGSGKSTLLKILAGILVTEHASIYYDDKSLQEYLINPGISALFHDLFLTNSLSVQKHFQLHAQFFGAKLTLEDWAQSFELTTKLQQKVSALSQGQKQKLAFALTLIPQNRLLLLDEPFANMDNTSIEICLNALKKYGNTFIATTHDPKYFDSFNPYVTPLGQT